MGEPGESLNGGAAANAAWTSRALAHATSAIGACRSVPSQQAIELSDVGLNCSGAPRDANVVPLDYQGDGPCRFSRT